MNLVITGGGTGGHVFAGIAIAEEFLNRSKGNRVLFIGSSQGMETRLVPAHGYDLVTIPVGKLVGQGFFTRLKTLLLLPYAIFVCLRELRSFQAEMVIGVGGYAAGPCMVAAKLLKLTTATLEQNSVMGFTNKISASLSNYVFTAFNEKPAGISKNKWVFTGNPVRSKFSKAVSKQSKSFTIFAFGGSQGATGINRLLVEAAQEFLKEQNQIQILHQTGKRDFEWVTKTYEQMGYKNVKVFEFIEDMQSMYNQADIVVCRAGSSTISELGATGNAAIFVPFPFAAGNHQEKNAKMVEEHGGARVLIQNRNNGKDLSKIIHELIESPTKIEKMQKFITDFHHPNAAARIVSTLEADALIKR